MQISFSNVGSNQIPIQAVRQLWPGRAALRRGWILPLLNLPDDRNGRRSRTVSCRFGPQRRFPWLPEAAQGPARPHEKSNNQDCGGEAEGNHPEWTMGTLMGKGEQKCQQRQRRRGDPLERRESPTWRPRSPFDPILVSQSHIRDTDKGAGRVNQIVKVDMKVPCSHALLKNRQVLGKPSVCVRDGIQETVGPRANEQREGDYKRRGDWTPAQGFEDLPVPGRQSLDHGLANKIKQLHQQKSHRQAEPETAGQEPMRKRAEAKGAKTVTKIRAETADDEGRKVESPRAKSPEGQDRRWVGQWKGHGWV